MHRVGIYNPPPPCLGDADESIQGQKKSYFKSPVIDECSYIIQTVLLQLTLTLKIIYIYIYIFMYYVVLNAVW